MKHMHEYMEAIQSLINGLPQSNLVNWFAIDSNGEVYGFRYKPKYYSNGWSQSVDHPECKIYEYFFGTVPEEYRRTTPEVKKMVFRTSDVEYTHIYDCNAEFEKILDFTILGDVLCALSNSGLQFVENWWVCTDSKKNTYAHEARPYIHAGSFASDARTKYLGSHLYVGHRWNYSLIQVKDIRAFMNKQAKSFVAEKAPEYATKKIPTDVAVQSIEQEITSRKYLIAKLEGEISALEIAKTILSN